MDSHRIEFYVPSASDSSLYDIFYKPYNQPTFITEALSTPCYVLLAVVADYSVELFTLLTALLESII